MVWVERLEIKEAEARRDLKATLGDLRSELDDLWVEAKAPALESSGILHELDALWRKTDATSSASEP